MIIMCGGAPCTGKSTLTRNILSELGSAEDVEPIPLFSCQKHGDILVTGRYPEGEIYGGSDRLSYGTISKFRDFINQEIPNYRHIIVEGDRFFRAPDVEWVLDNHDAKVYILTVDLKEETRRHKERNDAQDPTWLQGRRSVISNILTNFALMGRVEVRSNQTLEDSANIKKEILNIINKHRSGVSSSNSVRL